MGPPPFSVRSVPSVVKAVRSWIANLAHSGAAALFVFPCASASIFPIPR